MEVSIRNARYGIIMTLSNSDNENYPNGEYAYKYFQEVLINQYKALFPHSASATLKFLEELNRWHVESSVTSV